MLLMTRRRGSSLLRFSLGFGSFLQSFGFLTQFPNSLSVLDHTYRSCVHAVTRPAVLLLPPPSFPPSGRSFERLVGSGVNRRRCYLGFSSFMQSFDFLTRLPNSPSLLDHTYGSSVRAVYCPALLLLPPPSFLPLFPPPGRSFERLIGGGVRQTRGGAWLEWGRVSVNEGIVMVTRERSR